MSTYESPDIKDVLQEDVEGRELPIIVPVEIQGVVRTDEMPTISYYRNVIILTGAAATKVLQRNPRRKRVVISMYSLGAGAETLCVGENEGKATSFSGAMLFVNTTVSLRYEFTDKGELWARGAVINDTTGTFTGFGVSTDDIIMTIVEELWAE